MRSTTLFLGLLVAFVASGCGRGDVQTPPQSEPAAESTKTPAKSAAPAQPSAPAKALPPSPSQAKGKAPTPADLIQQVIVAADTKMKKGDTAGAVKFYTQAMRMNPKGHVPFQRLCVHYVKADPTQALPYCREWFQREPHEPTKKGIVPILAQLKGQAPAKK